MPLVLYEARVGKIDVILISSYAFRTLVPRRIINSYAFGTHTSLISNGARLFRVTTKPMVVPRYLINSYASPTTPY